MRLVDGRVHLVSHGSGTWIIRVGDCELASVVGPLECTRIGYLDKGIYYNNFVG